MHFNVILKTPLFLRGRGLNLLHGMQCILSRAKRPKYVEQEVFQVVKTQLFLENRPFSNFRFVPYLERRTAEATQLPQPPGRSYFCFCF